jgi:hypothetical protein
MLLMIGKMLGYYEIASLLGKRAMGEVYQAKDCGLAPIGAGAVNPAHHVYRCASVPN